MAVGGSLTRRTRTLNFLIQTGHDVTVLSGIHSGPLPNNVAIFTSNNNSYTSYCYVDWSALMMQSMDQKWAIARFFATTTKRLHQTTSNACHTIDLTNMALENDR
jgi:hypothetical protein